MLDRNNKTIKIKQCSKKIKKLVNITYFCYTYFNNTKRIEVMK